MRPRWLDGAVAGLAGGLVFGVMMQLMSTPTPDGGRIPMMAMVAAVVRSDNLAVGWLYHLFNSAVIGGLFGAILGQRADSFERGASLGALWGIVWWIVGALILMPLFLGMPALAPLRMAPMRPVALASLAGHLLFGSVLGLAYVRLRRSRSVPIARSAT